MSDEELKKSYYAIIPADVRYDERLPLGARLLYGEITALCNEKGYCWAGNKYFANLYKVTDRTVRDWISNLVVNGYITSDVQYKDGTKEIIARYLKILPSVPTEENFQTYGNEFPYPTEENFHTLRKKSSDPMEENFQPYGRNLPHNNTINNTINNTCEYNGKIKKIDPFTNPLKDFFKSEYKRIFGHSPLITRELCVKLSELAEDDEDIKEHITVAIQRLKHINFDFDNGDSRQPKCTWLLTGENFSKVVNGEFGEKGAKIKTTQDDIAEQQRKADIEEIRKLNPELAKQLEEGIKNG